MESNHALKTIKKYNKINVIKDTKDCKEIDHVDKIVMEHKIHKYSHIIDTS